MSRKKLLPHLLWLGGGIFLALNVWLLYYLPHADPQNTTQETLTIKQLTLKTDALPDHWLIINLWATWCLPCVREINEFNSLVAEYTQHHIQVIGVTTETITEQELNAFFQRYFKEKPRYTIEHHNHYSPILGKLQDMGLPQTLIFNPKGDLVDHHIGELTQAMLELKLHELTQSPENFH